MHISRYTNKNLSIKFFAAVCHSSRFHAISCTKWGSMYNLISFEMSQGTFFVPILLLLLNKISWCTAITANFAAAIFFYSRIRECKDNRKGRGRKEFHWRYNRGSGFLPLKDTHSLTGHITLRENLHNKTRG